MKGLRMLSIAVIGLALAVALVQAVAAQPTVGGQTVNCRVKADPILIGGASFLIPGLGQFLNGQDGKGLVHLVVALALPTAVAVAALMIVPVFPTGSVLFLLAPILYLGWALNSAIDAYNVSANYCRP
jgi:TM2 domain-containing membrane protein YozV